MRIFIFTIAILFTHQAYSKSVTAYCGKIMRLKGKVKILRLKDSAASKEDSVRLGIKAKKRTKLQCDDIILTERASRAKIKLNNKAILSLASSTRISLEEFISKSKGGANIVNLTYGKVRSFFKKIDNKQINNKKSKNKKSAYIRYKIKTKTAVAGVRGTDFFVSFEPNKAKTEQATLKGSVEVEQITTGQKVVVNAGKQVKVKAAPKNYSNTTKADLKPLVAVSITPLVAENIKQASVAVKNDKVFASKEAVAIIGKPNTWFPAKDELPLELKNIKEVF